MVELPPGLQRSDRIASDRATEKKANLIAVYNDANNYISTSIGPHRHQPGTQRRVQPDLRAGGQSDAVRGGFRPEQGSSRAGGRRGPPQLADGASRLDDGAGQLVAGLDSARSGSVTLATGAKQLSDGINEATDPLLAVTKALSHVGGSTEQLQQGANSATAGQPTRSAPSPQRRTPPPPHFHR